MTYAFIEVEKAEHDTPVGFACRVLGVSPAGFYEWRRRQLQPSRRTCADVALTATIRAVHAASRGTYGSPRVHAELRLGQDIRVGRKRLQRLMRTAGIVGVTRRRGRDCTRRNPDATPSDDLVNRAFTPDAPDRLWCADITEHPTGKGKVYLAAVLDAFSRRVVGWSIACHLRCELVVDALEMGLWRRKPPPGAVHHSDHGAQAVHVLGVWPAAARRRPARVDGHRRRLGYAVVESFFATLADRAAGPPRPLGHARPAGAMFDYIECFYNPIRRHSTLEMLSPIDYEKTDVGPT